MAARRESRRRTRKTGLQPVAGIAWYDSTQWTKLKQIAADTEQLDDTHEEWKRNVERTERQLAADVGWSFAVSPSTLTLW